MASNGHSVGPVRFASVSMVTATLGANDPKPGETCTVLGEQYLFVQNIGSSTAGVSKCVTVSGVSGYSVTVSTTTSVDYVVGVVKHADIATGSYGWVMTKGFCQIQMQADNSAAAGQQVTVAADGLFALKSNSTGYPAPSLGKVMAAVASGASATAYISLF